MINEEWRQKTIDLMAGGIYEVDPYPHLQEWDALCQASRRKSNKWHKIAKDEKRRCEERAEDAFNTLIQELPDNSDDDPIFYTQLLAMKD